MITGKFDYYKASSVADAIRLLQEHGDEAKILAGGHSLVPMMKLRLAEPPILIDLNDITELNYIKEEDGYLKIGAMTREADLEHSELIQSKYKIIHEAVKLIADPQVRNMATLGGNLAHGDPANDHPAVMLALNAEVSITGPNGRRTVPIDDFFHGFFMTAIQSGEILDEIRIPIPEDGSGGNYVKLERKVGDFATAGVGSYVVADSSGTCRKARVGLTNASTAPMRATSVENYLVGKMLNKETITEAAKLADEGIDPPDDLRGPPEYKADMFKVLTKRSLLKAAERARGGM